MAYVDMARAHVRQLLGEAMDLDEVVEDGDGDFPFRHGTAAYFVSVHPQGRLVRIWSPAVQGLRPVAPVLREVNDANAAMTWGRASLQQGMLVIEAVLPVEELVGEHLDAVCTEIGATADRLGVLLSAVHGGVVFFGEPATT